MSARKPGHRTPATRDFSGVLHDQDGCDLREKGLDVKNASRLHDLDPMTSDFNMWISCQRSAGRKGWGFNQAAMKTTWSAPRAL
jgi:hypothetical protein